MRAWIQTLSANPAAALPDEDTTEAPDADLGADQMAELLTDWPWRPATITGLLVG